MKKLNLIPDIDHLWKTLGYHFENLSQVIHEFVDNAISDFIRNKIKNGEIIITFKKMSKNKVEVIIEDHGKGIIDIENALTLGGMKFLNLCLMNMEVVRIMVYRLLILLI